MGVAPVKRSPLVRRTPLPRGRKERREVPEWKKLPEKAGLEERGPARSREFLEFVRGFPCMACARAGVAAPWKTEPHHFGSRGMGQKCSDFETVPLCVKHHREWHDRGTIGEELEHDEWIALWNSWALGALKLFEELEGIAVK